MYSWGNPDEGDPDDNACHMSQRGLWHVLSGGGVPTPLVSHESFSNLKGHVR